MESTMTTIQELKDLLTDEVWAALGDGIELSIETADGEKTIVLRAEPAEEEGEADPPVIVTAELGDIKLSDLAALTQLAGGVLPEVIPPQIPVADLIEFVGVEIVIEQKPTRRITSVTLEIQSAEPWPLIDGHFTLEELLFSITVTSPLDPLTREVSCTAESTLGFGEEVALDASMELPALNVALALAEDTEAPLAPLLASIMPDAGLPELTLTRLEADIQPREQSYAFAADIEQSWEVLPGIVTLNGLGIELSSTAGARPTGKVTGAFTMAGVELVVSASRSGGGTTPSPTPAVWLFEGGTAEDEEVAISDLLVDLTDKLGVPMPSFIDTLILSNLSAKLDNSTKNLSVRSEWESTGFVAIDSHPSLPAPLGKTLIASFSNPDGESASIKDMVDGVSPELAAIIPEGLTVTLNDALFASWKLPPAIVSKTIFGVDVGAGLDLSELPLVGQNFTSEHAVKLAYTIMIASDALTQPEVKALVPLFKAQGVTLGGELLPRGLTLRGELAIGDFKLPLNVPVHVNDNGQIAPAPGSRSDMEPQWFPLQKALGPVRLERVGVKFDDGELWLLLDASLSLGPLSLGLSGLSVSAPITMDAPPKFRLDGLALDYRTGPLEIGGSFLRQEVTLEGETFETYDGLALLKAKLGAKSLSLSAIGGYAQFQGEPSLFLYAVLGYPLGGHPFFFVEGLAAGFGINRALTVPTVDKINKFPLVREAMDGHQSIGDGESRAAILQEKMAALATYIKPQVGAGFLAVGVKFSSCKVVNGFVLLTMSLADRFELHLLGLARLTVPFSASDLGVDPIAQMEMALKASFIPEEGFLGVTAQLTSESFILSRDCKLTGGYAFYTWLAGQHAGDFVITMGGYHPRFPVPDHYPQVPRLGFQWSVGPAVIKGQQYFALCAHAVMAGGSLEVSFEEGSAHASFRASADFLIGWRPYHYDIELRVSISAGFGFLGDIDVSAGLRIWGPEFGGYAEIDVFLFSFTVKFGDQSSRYPKVIEWDDFQDGFLPPADEICSIAVTSGLLRQLKSANGQELWVVNPKDLALSTDAFVPTEKGVSGESRVALGMGGAEGKFGIRPMAVLPDEIETQHWIRITKITEDGERDVADLFNYPPVKKQLPSAVWGKASTVPDHPDRILPPRTDEALFVTGGVVAGFDIQVKALPKPGDTEDILTEKLLSDTTPVPDAFRWAPIAPFEASAGSDAERRERLRATVGQNNTRDQLLGALGFDPARDVVIDPASLAQAFVVAPQVQ